jgi:hypothetical protein
MGMATALGGAFLLALGAPLAVHTVAYARAAAAKRRARAACPFDDDDHETLALGRAAQLVAAESLLWLHAVATAPLAPGDDAPPAPGAIPIVVFPPRWVPASAVRVLVRRLRACGHTVVCPRLGPWPRDPGRRTALVDRALRSTWERHGARTVDVVAAAAAAPDVVAHLAAGGSGTPRVRRLITLGAAGAGGPRVPATTEVIALYSRDDPFLGSVEQARRPEAFTIALRGVGRLGLLHAPHVYELVREHLAAPPTAALPAWPTPVSS